MKLFAVGFLFCDELSIVGIFSTEEKAVEYIHSQMTPDSYAVTPVDLDSGFPDRAEDADYIWWPTLQTKENAISRAHHFREKKAR